PALSPHFQWAECVPSGTRHKAGSNAKNRSRPYATLQTFFGCAKTKSEPLCRITNIAGARGPTAILAASAHGQTVTSATSPFEPALCDLVHPRAHLVVGVGELASDLANPNGATTRLGLRQISLHAMNDLDMPKDSQPPSRHRFYIGSAAIFWFVVALGI